MVIWVDGGHRAGDITGIERYAYDAYGAVTILDAAWAVKSGGSDTAIRPLWQGLRLDDVSGIYHARSREVSTTLGRPLQRDPIGFAAGDVNVYRWVGNGPTGAVDPLGLYWGDFVDWTADRMHDFMIGSAVIAGNPQQMNDWLATGGLGTNVTGGLQVIGGVAETAGVIVAAPWLAASGPVGWAGLGVGFLHSQDTLNAGIATLETGQITPTYTYSGTAHLTGSSWAATGVDFAAGIGVSAAFGLYGPGGLLNAARPNAPAAGARPGATGYWNDLKMLHVDQELAVLGQIDNTCGIAALQSILLRRGIQPGSALEKEMIAALTRKGGQIEGLQIQKLYDALQKAGVNPSRPKLMTANNLKDSLKPGESAIVTISRDGKFHYVVVEQFTDSFFTGGYRVPMVQIVDSNEAARLYVTQSEFAKRLWEVSSRGSTVIIIPGT